MLGFWVLYFFQFLWSIDLISVAIHTIKILSEEIAVLLPIATAVLLTNSFLGMIKIITWSLLFSVKGVLLPNL